VLEGLLAGVVAEVGVVEVAGVEEPGVEVAGVVEVADDEGVVEVAGAAVVEAEVEEAVVLELEDAGLELEAEEPELVEAELEELPEEDEELPPRHDLSAPALMGKGAVVFVRPVLSRIWATALKPGSRLTFQVNCISLEEVKRFSTVPPERLSPSRISRKYGGTPPVQVRRVGWQAVTPDGVLITNS
jgi:hypothetical protein